MKASDKGRVTEIWVHQTSKRGTGYLFSAGCLLTARHVVEGCEPTGVRLRLLRPGATWLSSTQVWQSDLKRFDVALVFFNPAEVEEVDPPSVLQIESRDAIDCESCGFPAFYEKDGRYREYEPSGPLEPLKFQRYPEIAELQLQGKVPASGMEAWKGISGSPVLTPTGALVGIVTEGFRELRGETLDVLTICGILEHPTMGETFRQVLQSHRGLRLTLQPLSPSPSPMSPLPQPSQVLDTREQLDAACKDTLVRYREICKAVLKTSDPQRQDTLRQQALQLFQDAETLEQRLKQSETQNSKSNIQKASILDSQIISIDFSMAKFAVDHLLQSWTDGGCAILLLQNSFRMRADLLRQSIRVKLKEKPSNSSFSPTFVEASVLLEERTGLGLDRLGILQRLQRHFHLSELHLSEPDNLEDLELRLLEQIAQKLQCSNTTFLLELGPFDLIPEVEQTALLQWFLQGFWSKLQQIQTELAENYSRLRCVAIVYTDCELPQSCQPLCMDLPDLTQPQPTAFSSNQLLHLPLSPWTEQDIQTWVEDARGYSRPEGKKFAQSAMSRTGGEPRTVTDWLYKQLSSAQAS